MYKERLTNLPTPVRESKFATCFRANIFYRFREDLFPSLRDKINLFRDELEADRTSAPYDALAFRKLCDKLLELHKILTQIFSSITSPYDLTKDEEVEPNHLCLWMEEPRCAEPLNAYPWLQATRSILELADRFENAFGLVRKTLLEMIALSYLNLTSRSHANFDRTTIDRVRAIGIYAESLIGALSKPAFYYFSYGCQQLTTKISQHCIARIYKIISNGLAFIDCRQSGNSGMYAYYNRSRLHTFIPILKLTRLFINKISKGAHGELDIVSKMTMSHQNEMLVAVRAVTDALSEFVEREAWRYPKGDPIWSLPQPLLFKTLSTFTKPLEALNNYFYSITIFVSKGDLIKSRQAQDWCLMWAKQFDLAAKSFCIAYEKF